MNVKNNDEYQQDPIQGVQRGFTWLNEAPTPMVIETFLQDNWYLDHWESLAECARDLVKDEVEKSELQAIVTCRAKNEKSLREKLKMRHEKCNYGTVVDIRNDLYDLAGVRVILIVSTPEQREKVKEILHSIWGDNIEEKPHEGSKPSPFYKAKHIGYEAVHYRPFMKKEHEKGSYKHKRGDRVEVQVVSALGNAWAEAGHDVLYKTHAYGEPSMAEHRILDALNGIVRSGEVLLEQFHEAFMRRTKTKWEHLDQVGTFLREVDILQGLDEHNRFGAASLDILFQYLKRTEQHYPLAVRNGIRDIGYGKKPEDLQLDDIINSLEPAELEIADQMRATLCLIFRMMTEHTDEDLKKFCPLYEVTGDIPPAAVPNCLSIMITALTILQEFLGEPHKANQIFSGLNMDDDEHTSLAWILEDTSRYMALAIGESHREVHVSVKPFVQPLWNWLQVQTKSRTSIFGLCFRLAQMRATEEIHPVSLLTQLRIPPLSRVSTFSHDEEGHEEEQGSNIDPESSRLPQQNPRPGPSQEEDKILKKNRLRREANTMRLELERKEKELQELDE